MSSLDRVQAYEQYIWGRYFVTIGRALTIFDYFLTFGFEVRYIWDRPFSGATLLFLINRYANVIVTLFTYLSLTMSEPSHLTCAILQRLLQSELILASLCFTALSTLRVYALMDRRWLPTMIVFLVAMVSPVINLFIWIRSTTVVQSDSGGCTTVFTPIMDIYDELVIVARAFMIACDTLVIVFTVKRTIDVQRIVSRVHTRIGIVSLTLLRDSTAYYLLLLLMNVAQIMISAWNGPTLVAVLFTPITSVLTSRMILDLRQANRTLDADFTSFFATFGSDDQVDVDEDGDLDNDPSHEAVDGAAIPLRELDPGVTAQDPLSLP